MKNLLLIFVLTSALSTSAFSSATPGFEEGGKSILSGESIELNLTNLVENDYIVFSNFNADHNQVEITFQKNVSMIQAFDASGNLELVVPIMSNDVVLGMSLFTEGNYQLGFMIEGEEDIQLTELTIK